MSLTSLTESPKPVARRRTRVIGLAFVVAVVSACGGGSDAAGQLSADDAQASTTLRNDGPEDATEIEDQDEVDEVTSSTEADQTTTTTEPEPVLVPEMVGLTESEAQAALQNLGLSDAIVTYEESLESPGIVLEQVPSPGVDATGSISLIVSQAIAPIPDFVGSPVGEAREWTEARGIDLRVETELTIDVAGGEVLSQLPVPGGEVGVEVLVTIAETPVLLTLAELGTTASDQYDIGDLEMNGTLFAETNYMSVRLSGCCSGDSTAFADYNLSRDWTTLTLTLGIDDREPIDSSAIVEFSLDGQVVREETVVFGATNDVEIDVTGALRLRITVKGITGSDRILIGLGDAQLIGGSQGG